MLLTLLKSKIHCATVTEANLHYMGSITIDEDLMDACGMIAGEQVQVVNNMNGERVVTYVIAGPRGHLYHRWATKVRLHLLKRCSSASLPSRR